MDKTDFSVAESPAMPGCFSRGETLAEAEKNVEETFEFCIVVRSKN